MSETDSWGVTDEMLDEEDFETSDLDVEMEANGVVLRGESDDAWYRMTDYPTSLFSWR